MQCAVLKQRAADTDASGRERSLALGLAAALQRNRERPPNGPRHDDATTSIGKLKNSEQTLLRDTLG